MTLFNVFFSNRTEQLYESFKEHLFASSHPLSKRLVIVPSAAMKTWLLLKMANDPDLGIAAGIEVSFLEPAIQRLTSMLAKPIPENDTISQPVEPNELELALALEKTIHEIIHDSKKSHPTTLQSLCLPLFTYLGINHQKIEQLSRRSTKRITALSMVLSKLFVDYGRYGGRMVAEWDPTNPADWQQLLWQKMEKLFSTWNYPYRKLESFEMTTEWQPYELQVHLFGLSYIAPLHHRFFQKISKQLPVHYYIFSPCQQFWSDLLSDKERSRLMGHWQKQNVSSTQQEALEGFLRDNNSLLANFGRPGREMALQIEACDPILHEEYAASSAIIDHAPYSELASPDLYLQGTSHPLSLLEAVQGDVLLLRNPALTENVVFEKYDGTIQVHAAPKPMREVQVVYDTILSIIEKHRLDEDPITPGDIVVMAPDITAYAPFVRSVFESSESCLDLHLMDLQTPSQHSLVQGFLQLLQLPQGRWQHSQLLQLLENPAFKARHQFSAEDVRMLSGWIKEAEISWGNDSEHRNELLKRDHCGKEMVEECWHGTWEHGLGRLLEGLAMLAPDEKHFANSLFSPMEGVESTQAELLGIFLGLFRSLLADLKPLIDQTELSLSDWSDYLKCLFDAYFVCSSEDKVNYGYLLDQIDAFAEAETKFGEQKFLFHTIQRHLEQSLQAPNTSHKESNLQAVRFCSLLPMRAVPAKVIILMGMDDGKFPRTNTALSLNLLLDSPKTDYCPTQVEFDRYLFLESMLSARRYFIITYTSQSPGDPNPQLPSLLVKELLNYLESAFVFADGPIDQSCHFNHSLNPFHKKYFLAKSAFKSYSQQSYLAAKAYYHPQKKPPQNFLSAFVPLHHSQENSPLQPLVNLKDLTAFAKSPLKTYFNKTLNIYLESEEKRRINNDENLLVAAYDKTSLLKEALLTSPQAAFAKAEKSGRLPRGPFRAMEIAKLHREVEDLKNTLSLHKIDPEQFFSIKFDDHCLEAVASGPLWHLPPLSISHSFGNLNLTGQIDLVTPEGLVIFDENKLEDAIKIWPSLITLGCLIQKYSLPIAKQAIFIKGEKVGRQALDFADPESLLKNFLTYYFNAQTHPSPLLPQWVSFFLKGEQKALQAKFDINPDDAFRPIYDEYLKWLARNSPNADMHASMDHWQPTAQSLFVEMEKAWFSKSKGSKESVNDIV